MNNKINEQILAFQKANILKKDSTVSVPGQKPRHYLRLCDLLEAMREYFQDKEILLTQTYTTPASGTIICRTILSTLDETEKVENESVIFMGSGVDPQKSAAAMTYARRYGIMALLGVEAGDDDDGETAAGRTPEQQRQARPPANPAARPPARPAPAARPESPDAALNKIIDQAMVDLGVPVPVRPAVFTRLAARFEADKTRMAGVLTDMAANGDRWDSTAACLPCEK